MPAARSTSIAKMSYPEWLVATRDLPARSTVLSRPPFYETPSGGGFYASVFRRWAVTVRELLTHRLMWIEFIRIDANDA